MTLALVAVGKNLKNVVSKIKVFHYRKMATLIVFRIVKYNF